MSKCILNLLQHALNHPLVGTILTEFGNVDVTQFNEALNGFKTLDKVALASLSKLASTVANITECISTNRFLFYDDEEILETAVRPLLTNDTLLAGNHKQTCVNFGQWFTVHGMNILL